MLKVDRAELLDEEVRDRNCSDGTVFAREDGGLVRMRMRMRIHSGHKLRVHTCGTHGLQRC